MERNQPSTPNNLQTEDDFKRYIALNSDAYGSVWVPKGAEFDLLRRYLNRCSKRIVHNSGGSYFWCYRACDPNQPYMDNPQTEEDFKRYVICSIVPGGEGWVRVPFGSQFNALRGFLRRKGLPEGHNLFSVDGDYFNCLDVLTQWADELNAFVATRSTEGHQDFPR